MDTEEQDRGEEPIYQVLTTSPFDHSPNVIFTPTYQVPRSICLPIVTAAEEEEKRDSLSVNERPIVKKNVEEEGEEGATEWESFSSCQETLVPGRRRKSSNFDFLSLYVRFESVPWL